MTNYMKIVNHTSNVIGHLISIDDLSCDSADDSWHKDGLGTIPASNDVFDALYHCLVC